MKNNFWKIHLIEIIFFVYLFFLVGLQMAKLNWISIVNIIFFITLCTICYIQWGFAKSRKITKDLTLQLIIIFSLVYYFLIYMCGLKLGFLENAYSLKITSILINIITTGMLIITQEVFRYSYIRVNNKTKNLVLITLLFIAFDIIVGISSYRFNNSEHIFEALGLLILPSISKEILCTYLALKSSSLVSTTYRFFHEVIIYILPIIPAFSTYLQSVIWISFPIIILLIIDQQLEKYEKNKSTKMISRKSSYVYLPIILCLMLLVSLASGIFKYKMIAIGSNSMVPAIYKGDAVILREISKEEYLRLEKGDILAFSYDNKVIVHRIDEVKIETDTVKIITKGDANNNKDNYKISYSDIVGVVNLKIPYIGLPTVWVRETFGR